MKFVVLALSFLVLIGATATFSREYGVAHFSRGSVLFAFEGLAADAGVPKVPMNSRSMRELFETCGAVQQGAIYRFQTLDTRAAVDATCAGLAREALGRNPTYGAAHTILMFSSDSEPQIVESLVASHVTAPLESWHAKLRLLKGLPRYGVGQAALDRAVDLDIGFMMQSSGGRAWLARVYRSEPALRATLVYVIDRGPNDLKAGFLREIRSLDRG